MSPTGVVFRKQVDTLLDELSNCIGFCHQIRQTRRLGSKHDNFDNLLAHLLTSHAALSTKYDTLQQCFGYKMDIGDEDSVGLMSKCLRAVSSDIKTKLYEIANKPTQTTGPKQLPGFSALLQHWKLIEADASNSIIGLAQRLVITPPASTPVPTPIPSPKLEPQVVSDQHVVSTESLDFMIGHMHNSWTEKWSNEQIIYVNFYDEKITAFEKPDAFIKAVPASYRPTRKETLVGSVPMNEDLNERERNGYAYGVSNGPQREKFWAP
ncbi:hypothetical protein SBOR_7571 [Sclerotinia borealis F-4128]|uniref:Uncharacterized protein n=1 Tax=Sclerotinia borealis (strain F-4128) TaxID=1432307 RepID=W9C861_SCLBF|nr:hypothetical protein SBOR_7571 [Sclerotinia borealis F-4128]